LFSLIGVPLISIMMSPSCRPAWAAGPPEITVCCPTSADGGM
jgi:hypothetical protein